MLSSNMFLLISVILFIFTPETCVSEVVPSSLFLYSPGALDFTDVIVKRVGDNLTLVCELRGDAPPPALFVWNYLPASQNSSNDPYTISQNGSTSSQLYRARVTEADSGRYVCAAPPHSHAKYILVQQPGGQYCAPTALRCGKRCVLATNVCDGHADCVRGEDEAVHMCGPAPCDRPDRLNCSLGRCIPVGACCQTPHALCRQHSCCAAHYPRTSLDLELLPPFEDRRAPDDYGFIQSTIYTVTACALIFMIAVVLLVSAICKMHMKRAALRSYAHDHRYNVNLGVSRHRYPPCYEAADLLEQAVRDSPEHMDNRCIEEVSTASPAHGARLSALANVFSSRYRQVPTQCAEVEMLPVVPAGPPSPTRCATDEQHDRHRLTLQLGRFHLTIPSFRREPRPDTPNVAEINIDDLDFVRLNTNETYTLNGRTIRLLNGNFDNIPVLNNPPPYNEAMRYKLYGPPPEYLSRDRLNRSNSEENARSNIEMPPGYEEWNANVEEATNLPSSSFYCANIGNGNCSGFGQNAENGGNEGSDGNGGNGATNIGNPANIGSQTNIGNPTIIGSPTNIGNRPNIGSPTNIANIINIVSDIANIGNPADTENTSSNVDATTPTNGNTNVPISTYDDNLNNEELMNNNNEINETLNSVIDNLPAIDSDVNANGEICDYVS